LEPRKKLVEVPASLGCFERCTLAKGSTRLPGTRAARLPPVTSKANEGLRPERVKSNFKYDKIM
jgi:hypothetical protein